MDKSMVEEDGLEEERKVAAPSFRIINWWLSTEWKMYFPCLSFRAFPLVIGVEITHNQRIPGSQDFIEKRAVNMKRSADVRVIGW